MKTVTAEQLSQICVCDWLEGVGDILSLAQANFIRRFGSRLLEQREVIRRMKLAIHNKFCAKLGHQKMFLNDGLHAHDIDGPETPGGGGCIYCTVFRLSSENEKLRERIENLEQQGLNSSDEEPTQ